MLINKKTVGINFQPRAISDAASWNADFVVGISIEFFFCDCVKEL
jgi:hypothetical protein